MGSDRYTYGHCPARRAGQQILYNPGRYSNRTEGDWHSPRCLGNRLAPDSMFLNIMQTYNDKNKETNKEKPHETNRKSNENYDS